MSLRRLHPLVRVADDANPNRAAQLTFCDRPASLRSGQLVTKSGRRSAARQPVSKAAGCAKKLFMIAHMPQVAELQRRLKYGYNEFAGIWRSMACMARKPRPPFGSESCRAGNCAPWPTTNQTEILGAS